MESTKARLLRLVDEACQRRGAVLRSRQVDALIEVLADEIDDLVLGQEAMQAGLRRLESA